MNRLFTALALACCLVSSGDTMQAKPGRNPALPDPQLTPGAVNPDITQANIDQTICANARGGHWSTKSIRPPTSYTNKLKRKQIAQYGYADKKMADYELDHLISLTLGGAPRDPKNLWPESYSGQWGARTKDKVEVKLNRLVCNGTLTLKEAQAAISGDWIAAYRKYVAD